MKILSIFTGRSDHTERDRFIHLLERSAALYYRTRGYVLFMRESVAKKRADGSRKKKQMRLNFENIQNMSQIQMSICFTLYTL